MGFALKKIRANRPRPLTLAVMGTAMHAGYFSEGLARIKVEGKWGYIGKTGKMVIEPVFKKAGDFRNGLPPVKIHLP